MADAQKTNRPGRVLKAVLFVSLALNLLVAGLVGGAILRGDDARTDRRPPPASAFGVGSIVQALPDTDRRALGREMMQELRRNGLSRRELDRQTARLVAALRADPFDAAAAEAALDAQVSEAWRRLGIAKTLFVTRITAMDADQRAALAQSIEEGQKSRPRNGGERPKPPRD
ncbi:MAG: periplasmic heavy metal sensor [Pseudomonadota bacterium]